jgi:transposase
MDEELRVQNERVDDIPILLTQMERMGLRAIVDEQLIPHGNWQGLSPGQVVEIWMSHILSQADHRLNHVQSWAAKRIQTLSACLGVKISELDFTDDRLARVLDQLGEDHTWGQLEMKLNQHLLRVYDLPTERVRLDSTTVSGYWTVTEEGVFQFGQSKDHRSNQPQIKVMLSTLDPLGLPLVTQVVDGQRSDDPLYVPAIEQVRACLGCGGKLYIGDSKMPARSTRALLQAGGDYYLAPLSQTQLPPETLEAYLQEQRNCGRALQPITRLDGEGQEQVIGKGFERSEPMNLPWEQQSLIWVERRLIICSLAHRKTEQDQLEKHLQHAQAALEELTNYRKGKKRYVEVAPLQAKAEAILQQFEVVGLLQVIYEASQPEGFMRYRIPRQFRVKVTRDENAIQQAQARLGWRVYATNAPTEQLPMQQAVLAYREEYVIEHSFSRLKGTPLTLSPMYLQDDGRATGLVRLLSIGLRVLTLLEFVVRRKLMEQPQGLAGLYAGNPKRTTSHPTSELLLEAFDEVTLTSVSLGPQTYWHITPLSPLQLTILKLLDFPGDLYSRLALAFTNSS